jgi:hypothetical protein
MKCNDLSCFNHHSHTICHIFPDFPTLSHRNSPASYGSVRNPQCTLPGPQHPACDDWGRCRSCVWADRRDRRSSTARTKRAWGHRDTKASMSRIIENIFDMPWLVIFDDFSKDRWVESRESSRDGMIGRIGFLGIRVVTDIAGNIQLCGALTSTTDLKFGNLVVSKNPKF